MVCLLLAVKLITLSASSTIVPRESWVDALMETDMAKAALSVKEARFPIHRAPTDYEIFDPKHPDGSRVLVSQEFIERARLANSTVRHMAWLVQQNRIKEAYSYVHEVREAHPQIREQTTDMAVECSLFLGRYVEAYNLLVRQLQDEGRESDERFLRLSLASAARGQVFPGQVESCIEGLRAFLPEQFPWKTPDLSKFTKSDPKSVEILSCFALGVREGWGARLYLELALRLDPANETVAAEAIDQYKQAERYSDARRVASNIAKHLPRGESQTRFLREIEQMTGLKDRPLPRETTGKE